MDLLENEFVTVEETTSVQESQPTETIEYVFETVADTENTNTNKKNSLGLVAFVIIIVIIIGFVCFMFSKNKKKKKEQAKVKAKVGSANAKFLRKKEEANENLDKYATALLNKYDFYDEGDDKTKPIIFRDLYKEEKDIRDKETENKITTQRDIMSDFLDEDATTIKKNKLKSEKIAQLKEELDDGLTNDIDDYFNRQNLMKDNLIVDDVYEKTEPEEIYDEETYDDIIDDAKKEISNEKNETNSHKKIDEDIKKIYEITKEEDDWDDWDDEENDSVNTTNNIPEEETPISFSKDINNTLTHIEDEDDYFI